MNNVQKKTVIVSIVSQLILEKKSIFNLFYNLIPLN